MQLFPAVRLGSYLREGRSMKKIKMEVQLERPELIVRIVRQSSAA
jgi:hypothetical protein